MNSNQQQQDQYNGGGDDEFSTGNGGSLSSPTGSKKKKKIRILKKLGRMVGRKKRNDGSSDDGSVASSSASNYSDLSSQDQHYQQQPQQQPPYGSDNRSMDEIAMSHSSVDRHIMDQVIEEEDESDGEDDDEDDDEEEDTNHKRTTFSSAKANRMISKKAKELPHDHISDEALSKTGNSLASNTSIRKDSTSKGTTVQKISPTKKQPSINGKKKTSPKKRKTGAVIVGPVSLVILLIDPVSLRFELLQLAFESPADVTVLECLTQASQNVTEHTLKGLSFTKILDGDGTIHDSKTTIAAAVSKRISSSSSTSGGPPAVHKDLFVAALPSTSPESITKLTRPILADKKVVSMLKGQGYDLQRLGYTQKKERGFVLDQNTAVGERYRPTRTVYGLPISLAVMVGIVVVLCLGAVLIRYGSRWYAAEHERLQKEIDDRRSKELLLKEETNVLAFLGVASSTAMAEALAGWKASFKSNVIDPTTSATSTLYSTILSMSSGHDEPTTAGETSSKTPTVATKIPNKQQQSPSTSDPSVPAVDVGTQPDPDVLDLD